MIEPKSIYQESSYNIVVWPNHLVTECFWKQCKYLQVSGGFLHRLVRFFDDYSELLLSIVMCSDNVTNQQSAPSLSKTALLDCVLMLRTSTTETYF